MMKEKMNQQSSILRNIFLIIVLITLWGVVSIHTCAASKGNEFDAYEKFIKEKQSVSCRGVQTVLSVDSFCTVDINGDGIYELIVADQNACRNTYTFKGHTHVIIYKYEAGRVKLIEGLIVKKQKNRTVYVSTQKGNVLLTAFNKEWGTIGINGEYNTYRKKPSLALYKKIKLYQNTEKNRNKYLKQKYLSSIKNNLDNEENTIQRLAVSFAGAFSEKAQSASGTTTQSAKQQLEKLRKQLLITGDNEEVPDEVLEAFATAVLNTIKSANIDEYETNPNKLTKQICNQIAAGMKTDSKRITLGTGRKKTTYTVKVTIWAQSFKGLGAQVSQAEVTWADANNRRHSVRIMANSSEKDMEKALASYCAVLAQLNKGLWKDFLVKYITGGWKLADLNTIRKLDDKTVSKFFDYSEKLILTISGDKNAKKGLLVNAGGDLKTSLSKMSKKKFQEFIKKNVPNGDQIVKTAEQYKKVKNKYKECKKKFDKWNKTRKNSDLQKYEKDYENYQLLLDSLNEMLKSM